MKNRVTIEIETISNGFVIEHVESGRKRFAAYDFGVIREVEQLMRDERDAALLASAPAPGGADVVAASVAFDVVAAPTDV